MAATTDISLRNSLVYSVYIRNHTREGSFHALCDDLPRIRQLGTSIIWLMPIHPIGEKSRKGTLGSPYAIKDYRSINPEHGSLKDFIMLIEAIHRLGMKVIIDIVFHHTAHDALLYFQHPDWYYHTPEGNTANRIDGWTDIIDLDFTHRELWDYHKTSLKYWVSLGVDGFRCDVAPMLPLAFWLQARQEIAKLNPGIIWLAESVRPAFSKEIRERGLLCHTDKELYQAFDITYEYDIYEYLVRYLNGATSLEHVLDKIREQEKILPENYIKLRFLENHDLPRATHLFPRIEVLKNWLAFQFFNKGTPLIYAGQEFAATCTPSLFEKDTIEWGHTPDLSNYIRQLAAIKKDPLMRAADYKILRHKQDGVIIARYKEYHDELWGVFNVEQRKGDVQLPLPDINYKDLLTGTSLDITNNNLLLTEAPVIFRHTHKQSIDE